MLQLFFFLLCGRELIIFSLMHVLIEAALVWPLGAWSSNYTLRMASIAKFLTQLETMHLLRFLQKYLPFAFGKFVRWQLQVSLLNVFIPS